MVSLRDFWRLPEGASSVVLPYSDAVMRAGRQAIEAAVVSGVGDRGEYRPGDLYPCAENAEPGCHREVHGGVDGLYVSCGLVPAQCLDEQLRGEAGERFRMDQTRVVAWLRRELRIHGEQPVPDSRAPVEVGRIAIGIRTVGFYWTCSSWRGRWPPVGAHAEELSVVVCPMDQRVDIPPAIDVVALERGSLVRGGHLRLDLSSLYLAHRFQGIVLGEVLWPRYLLVHEPERGSFHYCGRKLGLDDQPVVSHYLSKLCERPGARWKRKDLIRALWAEDLTAKGEPRMGRDWGNFNADLRKVRQSVKRAFESLPPEPGQPRVPINVPVGGRGEEADMLELPRADVFVVPKTVSN